VWCILAHHGAIKTAKEFTSPAKIASTLIFLLNTATRINTSSVINAKAMATILNGILGDSIDIKCPTE
jgi:hypothetical protein